MTTASPVLRFSALVLVAAACAVACGDDDDVSEPGPADPNDLSLMQRVLDTNADIAFASYSDAVTTAEALKTAIDTFVATPTEANFQATKQAWL